MSDFFREVDEEVRRDRAVLFVQRYLYWLIALAVLIVAGTAGWRFYEASTTHNAEAAGSRYETAAQLVRDGKDAEAAKDFAAMASDAPPGYRTLARLEAADALAVTEPKQAIDAYEVLANDPQYDASLQGVARLRAAMLRVDSDDPKAFETRYAPYAADTNPFRNSIRELLALSALKTGNVEAAGRWLDAIIVDPQAPASLRQRADAFLGLVRAGKLPAP